MIILTVEKAQKQLAKQLRMKRLTRGLTQEGLAVRADVSLSTLRKFEQKGVLSLESFLKLSLVLGDLERVVEATKPQDNQYASIDDVLAQEKKVPKRGCKK